MPDRRLLLAVLVLAGTPHPLPPPTPSVLARYDLSRPSRTVVLPKALVEVSGLAALPDGRLLTHNDESPTIYMVDPLSGAVVRTIELAGRAQRGDFEEILLVGDTAFLAESDGTIFRIPLPPKGRKAHFTRVQGLPGGQCEVESLGHDIGRPGLVVLCKRVRGLRDQGAMLGYRWSYQGRGYERRPSLRVPWEAFGPKADKERFAASGMTRTLEGRSWIVLDGPNQRIAEVDSAGRVLNLQRLPRDVLPQAEGVTIAHDGTLYIASEGRHGPAILAIYYPIRPPAS